MTAIVKFEEQPSLPAAKLGLLLPGLGHLFTGSPLVGFWLLSQAFLLMTSAVAGFPRIHSVLFSEYGNLSAHGAISLGYWGALALLLWWAAARRIAPRKLTEDEFNSNRAIFLRQFGRNRSGLIGIAGVTFLASLTILTPLIAPFDPNTLDLTNGAVRPGWHEVQGQLHWFVMGTDQNGRDSFSRVLYGGRISLVIGLIAVSIAATIGVSIGAIAGFYGGWLDRILMWFVDLLLSLPSLVLLLAIVGIVRASGPEKIFLIVVILGFTGWMGVSRIVRSQVLSLKEQDFIQAARALGLSNGRIVFRHLIPNALAPVIVYCSLAIGGIILAEAGLSFLGLGVSPPTATWGTLVADGKERLDAPWIVIFPGLFIISAVMSFNLLGDGLRDALDPKLRGR